MAGAMEFGNMACAMEFELKKNQSPEKFVFQVWILKNALHRCISKIHFYPFYRDLNFKNFRSIQKTFHLTN